MSFAYQVTYSVLGTSVVIGLADSLAAAADLVASHREANPLANPLSFDDRIYDVREFPLNVLTSNPIECTLIGGVL